MAKTRCDGHSHVLNESDRHSELLAALETDHLPNFDGLQVLDPGFTVCK